MPISTPSGRPDAKLAGRWLGDDNRTYVVRVRDMVYDIKVEHTDTTYHGADRYEAYLSTVKGVTFLNMYEPGPKPSYDIYKVEFPDKNTIEIREMSSDINEKFTTSQQLQQYIERNMYREGFHRVGDGPLTLERL